jgi:MFS family permease
MKTREFRRRAREFSITSGTLGSTSAQTLMVALLPVLLAEHAPSAVWIGLVISSEGLFSLLLPWVIGRLSDRVPGGTASAVGRRNLFLIIAAPLMAIGLVAAPFLGSYWALAAAAFVFFAFLRVYVTPLRALMVDSVPQERWGRVEGARGLLHSIGLGFGLTAGGFLFDVWRPLPFVIAAALLLVTTAVTYFTTPEESDEKVSQEEADDRNGNDPPEDTGADRDRSIWRELREDAPLRWFLTAHMFWTAAVDGIRPYIFVFATVVLGVQVAETSALLLVLLAGLAIGSFASGWLSDRLSRPMLLLVSATVLGIAMCAGVFIRTVPVAVVLLLPVGLGAASLISLPYPLFATLVGRRPIGQFTGVFEWAVGLAQLFPPILVGAAIDLAVPLFPEEQGYPIMWPVVGVMALVGAASLFRLTRLESAPREMRGLSLSAKGDE